MLSRPFNNLILIKPRFSGETKGKIFVEGCIPKIKMHNLKQIYDRLLKTYGKQGWWPIINKKSLLCEYYVNAPNNEDEELEICIGAILTQNTSWKNAEKAIAGLSENHLIDCKGLLKIDEKRLANILMPSGYYNQKAKKLIGFSLFLKNNYSFSLKDLFATESYKLREELLSINGIGEETADSIILYAANKPIFVVDAYTKRILSRIGICNEQIKYKHLQSLITRNLGADVELFKEYHALLVKLGKEVCKKIPLCTLCPILNVCGHGKNVKKRDKER